ncbi:MAG: pseudouridine synthase, partial [Planctomycetota bacterium]
MPRPARNTKPTASRTSARRATSKRGAAKSAPSETSPSKQASPQAATAERLQKVLAAAGIGSRRECELLITEGRVEVDDRVVTELGAKVDPATQRIHVDGEPLPQTRRVYFAVNKPEGFVSTARDPSGRPRVIDLVPPDAGRLFNVGRLDLASEGLILVTNDGGLANQLTHPRHGVEKTYHVQVAGHPTAETLATLRKGVYLSEGAAHFVHAKVKSRRKNGAVLEVVLDEGRNREIRRVLARVGHKVQRLTRVAVGPVRLG